MVADKTKLEGVYVERADIKAKIVKEKEQELKKKFTDEKDRNRYIGIFIKMFIKIFF